MLKKWSKPYRKLSSWDHQGSESAVLDTITKVKVVSWKAPKQKTKKSSQTINHQIWQEIESQKYLMKKVLLHLSRNPMVWHKWCHTTSSINALKFSLIKWHLCRSEKSYTTMDLDILFVNKRYKTVTFRIYRVKYVWFSFIRRYIVYLLAPYNDDNLCDSLRLIFIGNCRGVTFGF